MIAIHGLLLVLLFHASAAPSGKVVHIIDRRDGRDLVWARVENP